MGVQVEKDKIVIKYRDDLDNLKYSLHEKSEHDRKIIEATLTEEATLKEQKIKDLLAINEELTSRLGEMVLKSLFEQKCSDLEKSRADADQLSNNLIQAK